MKKALTVVLVAAFAGLVVSGSVMAAPAEDPCVVNPQGSICNEINSGDSGLPATLKTVINVLLMGVGIVAVIMIIIGAINYITSGGDPGKTAKARSTITYAIVGLVVALLSFAIVNFVIQRA